MQRSESEDEELVLCPLSAAFVASNGTLQSVVFCIIFDLLLQSYPRA
jgi:hypothetical protein